MPSRTRKPRTKEPSSDRPYKSHFRRFGAAYPDVAAAYSALSDAMLQAGPLDPRTQALVKLAVACGTWREGAVHSSAARALAAGCSADEIRHTVVLTITTLGFPSMMAAMRWTEDVLGGSRKAGRGRRGAAR